VLFIVYLTYWNGLLLDIVANGHVPKDTQLPTGNNVFIRNDVGSTMHLSIGTPLISIFPYIGGQKHKQRLKRTVIDDKMAYLKLRQSGVLIDIHALFCHYMSVESCCTVVVKQCMEIYQFLLFYIGYATLSPITLLFKCFFLHLLHVKIHFQNGLPCIDGL